MVCPVQSCADVRGSRWYRQWPCACKSQPRRLRPPLTCSNRLLNDRIANYFGPVGYIIAYEAFASWRLAGCTDDS